MSAGVISTLASFLLLALCSGYSQAAAPAAQELPTGGQVAAGQATVSQSGGQMAINQSTNSAVINWNTFNVGSQAQVNIYQPSASSALLNRVTGGSPSQIFGQIHANGQAYLSNPNGVFIAPGATAQSAGFVATTMGISNSDFMSGKRTFSRNGSTASVVNEGTISATDGGYVALLATDVRNEGVVVANMGTVAMAGGEKIELQIDTDNQLVNLIVDPATVRTEVQNRHAVMAAGGQIILSARSLSKLQASVIKNDVQLDTSSLVSRGGRIMLEADDISIGEHSEIMADGATKGGTVEIGGSWQGKGKVYEARQVTVDKGAVISASAKQTGDGGQVVIRSNVADTQGSTTGEGTISASGINGGKGGKVETSGYELSLNGSVNMGRGGEWLLDPVNMTVTNSSGTLPTTGCIWSSAGSVSAQSIIDVLNNGGSVTLDATAGSGGNGSITIASAITKTAGNDATLTLNAGQCGIAINAAISSTSNKLNVTLNSTGGISSSAAGTINTNGGVLTFNNAATGTLNGVISVSGSVLKQGAGLLNLAADNTYSGGTTIRSGTVVDLVDSLGTGSLGTGNVTLAGGNLQFNSGVAVGNIIFTNNIDVTANSGLANDNGYLQLKGRITLGQGATLLIGGSGAAQEQVSVDGVIAGAGNLNVMSIGLTFDNGPVPRPGSSSGMIDFSADNTFTGNLTVSSGQLNVSGDNSKIGHITILSGAGLGVIGNKATIGNADIVNNGGFGYERDGSLTYSGSITGNGTFAVIGGLTLNLSGNNEFSNSTLYLYGSDSKVILSGHSGFSTDTSIRNYGAMLEDVSGTLTQGSISLLDDPYRDGFGRVVFAADRNTTFAGTIKGAGSVVKQGSGLLTFTSNNTYTGGTTISGGTLKLNIGYQGSGSLGTGQVTLAGGNLQFNSGDNLHETMNSYNFNNNFVVTANSALASNSGMLHLNGSISLGAGSTLKVGGSGLENLYLEAQRSPHFLLLK